MKNKTILEGQAVEINVGFWRRFLARMVDFLLIGAISIPLSLLFTTTKNHSIVFVQPAYFYIWAFITVLLMFIIMIAIPLVSRGQSLGYMLLGIKVKAKNIYKAILKREMFYGFAWILMMLLVIVVINHTLISRVIKIKGSSGSGELKLSTFDQIRINIVGSLSAIISFMQMFVAITIIPNKLKQGWHDRAAENFVVYTRKKLIIKRIEKIILKPQKIKKIEYLWVKKEKHDE